MWLSVNQEWRSWTSRAEPSDAAAAGWSFVPSKFILSGVLRASWDDSVSLHPELQVSLAAG